MDADTTDNAQVTQTQILQINRPVAVLEYHLRRAVDSRVEGSDKKASGRTQAVIKCHVVLILAMKVEFLRRPRSKHRVPERWEHSAMMINTHLQNGLEKNKIMYDKYTNNAYGLQLK